MGVSEWLIIEFFITALKASWMRRLIRTDTKWVKLLESILGISISEIWRNGPDYSYLLCKKFPALDGKTSVCFGLSKK